MMNTANVTTGVLAAAMTVMACAADTAAPDTADGFEAPFRVKAGDAFIDVEVGHAAPLVTDWDGDGANDLLVGQFRGGMLRIYRNHGTDESPRFEDFAMFQTRKGLGSIPSG